MITLLLIGKIFALLALAIYIVFALVIIRQVKLMTATIQAGFEGFIKLIAWAHLLFAIFVFITAWIIL